MCDSHHSSSGPSNSGKGNALGFSGPNGSGCYKHPCPAYPIHTVNICVLVNLDTEVRIQQGCLGDHDHDEDDDHDQSDITYSSGQTYDSWGRKCRVVSWSRKVTDDAFIRMRFIGAEEDEPCDAVPLHGVTNQLLKFEIDGLDLIPVVDRYLALPYGMSSNYSYLKAGCMGGLSGGSGCCELDVAFVPTWNKRDIPRGAEIVVGPISELPYVTSPPIVL